ncbi:MAG: peptidase E [Ferruginibacter sp.]|nr:peptidase E [Chitinophagaceae bacterium]
MKPALLIFLAVLVLSRDSSARPLASGSDTSSKNSSKVVFVYGGHLNKTFLKYIITLTGKSNPKICFLPTASGDNPGYIDSWNKLSKQFSFTPHVLLTFSAASNSQAFEEQLLQMDVIIVGAGNAVNMLAIWKAQGIDTVLQKAYDRGIVIAGGSAGSLCWFGDSYTGSRPLGLTKFTGLNFLNFSHCPHYHSDPKRKPVYQQGVLSGEILPGYACDDLSGILFINGSFKKSVSQNKENNNYFVSRVDGKLKEELLVAEIIK